MFKPFTLEKNKVQNFVKDNKQRYFTKYKNFVQIKKQMTSKTKS